MPDDKMPEFPPVSAAQRLSDDDKTRIAEAAWAQSNGSVRAFNQLCAEHVVGDIDLFSENPTAISRRRNVTGPGDDAYTATGGDTHDTRAPASAAPAGSPQVGSMPETEDALRAGQGVVTQNTDLAGIGPGNAAEAARAAQAARAADNASG